MLPLGPYVTKPTRVTASALRVDRALSRRGKIDANAPEQTRLSRHVGPPRYNAFCPGTHFRRPEAGRYTLKARCAGIRRDTCWWVVISRTEDNRVSRANGRQVQNR